jgi:LmbE family N-acetylglucosaminyl deacetylase
MADIAATPAKAAIAASAAHLGRTLVLAPHPDDETIGCGGLLALLGRAGAAVRVVLLSDGTASHRHSAAYPAARLRALRQREMTAALRELAHAPDCLETLGLQDGAVPTQGEPGFDAAVGRVAGIMRRFGPDTVLMPAHGDAHRDHRAACAIGVAACEAAAPAALRLEFAVWGADWTGPEAWPIDVGAVVADKQRALAQHRSQLGLVVCDDPQGFILPPDLLARCARPVEIYCVAFGDPRHV